MSEVICVSHLLKTYPSPKGGNPLLAVNNLEFAVRKGEIFGFLGPNGAGKTTTIRMLTGLITPTSGTAEIFGVDLLEDPARIKKQIGVVPDTSNLYDELSAFDNLVFDMQLYGVPRSERATRAEALLMQFGLSEKRNTLFAKLSRGMKRALTIAAALAHRPKILFLDEPTTGLDVISARKLRQLIAGLREQGVTVFLTTHYLEEAERLCDRIALIVKGQIIALDTVDGLKRLAQSSPAARVEITWRTPRAEIETCRVEADTIEAAVEQALARARGCETLSVKSLQPTLEDVFVKLTGLGAEVILSEKGNGKGKANAGG
jgi:ABC-2 type transport system ATP-binding protein